LKSTSVIGACAAGISAALLAFPFPAAAQTAVQAGILRCDVSAGIGLIVTSRRNMRCAFEREGGRIERYSGTIRRFGLDLGATAGGVLVWTVFTTPPFPTRGGIGGTYVGASAEASAIAGVGANALVGGSNRRVSLQPLSVQGQVGVNLAVGVADLRLVRTRQ
jgi:hypothetical protein